MTTLTSLNDDCLREILEYCDLDDHMALILTCKRFKTVVQSIWKLFWKELRLAGYYRNIEINLPNGVMGKINEGTMKLILEVIHELVETLKISGQTDQLYQILKNFTFPKVTKLILHNTRRSLITPACFPNLRIMVLEGNLFVRRYGPQWIGLENLDLNSSYMKISKIMEIVSQLKLKKLRLNNFDRPIPAKYKHFEYFSDLEELSAYEYGMNECLNALKDMKNLKKLTLMYHNNTSMDNCLELNNKLSKQFNKRLVEFSVCCESRDNKFFKNIKNNIQQLPCLQKLTVISNSLSDINLFSFAHPLVKEFVVQYAYVNVESLTKTLCTANDFEFLELQKTKTGTIRLDVNKIAKKRTNPININVSNEDKPYKKTEIQLSGPTNLITITNYQSEDKRFLFQYILEEE